MSTVSNKVHPTQGAAVLQQLINHSSLFTAKELHAASLTCKFLSDYAKEPLEELAVNQLVEYVIFGNEAKAKEMLEANPKLLLKEGVATDYSGRIINATAFQAALGAEDEHMWAMMAPYFELLQKDGQIKSAKEEMLTQFNLQFPNGFESSEADTKKIFDDYQELATDIVNAADDTAKKEIIDGFRAKLNTNGQNITEGKHFNMQHLIAAYKAYIDNFDNLATWPNRDMFWQKVIGYVQRQMPANFAQAHCTGIKTVVDNPAKFKRTLIFGNGGKFFPAGIDSGLGFDFAFCPFGHCIAARCAPHVRMLCPRLCLIGKLCETKIEKLRQFKRDLESIEPKQAHGSFVIC